MTDVDTMARRHAAVTRSWLSDIEPPPLRSDSLVTSPGTGQRGGQATRSRWSPVWAFGAGFAVVIALGVVMVALSLNRGGTDLAGVGLRPVELGLGYVWSDQSDSSSPDALGAAFAAQVLGWDQATVESMTGADPTGPVGIRISHPGRQPIDIVTSPTSGSGRVILQIGAPSTVRAVVPGEPAGTRIGLVQYPDATHAEVTVRVIDSETEVVFTADADDLAVGYAETSEIPDAIEVATVMVRYLNDDGEVVAVDGGHIYTPETSEVNTAADGEPVSPPTTVPADQRERYYIRLAILDDIATVDGEGIESEIRDIAGAAIDARCSAPSDDSSTAFLDETEPAYETANLILNSLNCDVSTMAVTIDENGAASGVIGVLDPGSVDEIQQAVGEAIEVQIDHADL